MTSWQEVVRDRYEDSPEAAQGFIAEVQRHLDAYHALEFAQSWHQEPKDTFVEVQAIRQQAGALADLLDLAKLKHSGLSWLRQGVAIAKPDALHWSEVDGLAAKLHALAAGADAMLAAAGNDPSVHRRGWGKPHPRWELVQALRETYEWYFDEPAEVKELDFRHIAEAILDSVGIPRKNLSRLLKESEPPR